MLTGSRPDWGREWGRAVRLAVVALLCGLLGVGGALAAETIEVSSFRMAGDATRTRIVVNFDAEFQPRWFLLRAPHRLVVDLPAARFAIDPEELKPRGLVKSVRYGSLDAGKSRMIFGGKGPFSVETFDIVKNENAPGHRLIVDIIAADEDAFDAALALQADKTASTPAATDRPVAEAADNPKRKFTVVIDPGHGGIDGGAEGISGTVEKDITLAFSLELRERLAANQNYMVVMTREKDEFLRLDDRVRIARQAGADLLISIHADTIRVRGVHGATVYTVSDKASDEEARALAERENLADQVAGMTIAEENQEVADILVDLVRRETHGFSIRFARSLVQEMSGAIDLIKNPHRSAGFRVLRAPDVPSVLVELGYLSNLRDEERLRDPQWRTKAVDSIIAAVRAFAGSKAEAGG